MINLVDKYGYIIAEIERQGYTLYRLDGVWVCNNETEVQSIIDSYNPIGDARVNALKRINKQTSDYVNSQVEDYPDFEKETWELQRQEAQAYNANNNSLTPTIDTIAINRGVDRVYLIERININTENWRSLSATVAGKRQKLLDQVYSETDYTVVENINFEV